MDPILETLSNHLSSITILTPPPPTYLIYQPMIDILTMWQKYQRISIWNKNPIIIIKKWNTKIKIPNKYPMGALILQQTSRNGVWDIQGLNVRVYHIYLRHSGNSDTRLLGSSSASFFNIWLCVSIFCVQCPMWSAWVVTMDFSLQIFCLLSLI